MFIGHFATADAARRLAPRPSLGTLFAAAPPPDLVWPGNSVPPLMLAGGLWLALSATRARDRPGGRRREPA